MTQHRLAGSWGHTQRSTRAAEHRERHLKITPKQQLKKLDQSGYRALKERARLEKLISAGLGDKTFAEIHEMKQAQRRQAEQDAIKRRAEELEAATEPVFVSDEDVAMNREARGE